MKVATSSGLHVSGGGFFGGGQGAAGLTEVLDTNGEAIVHLAPEVADPPSILGDPLLALIVGGVPPLHHINADQRVERPDSSVGCRNSEIRSSRARRVSPQ